MGEFHEVAPFDPTKKKKKKKVNFTDVGESSGETTMVVSNPTVEVLEVSGAIEEARSSDHLPQQLNEPIEQRDYLYEELLENIYGAFSLRSKTSMKLPVPQVLRHPKKTVLSNFLEFCKTMHRSPEHLQSYLEAELATNASVDGSNKLVLNGRFNIQNMESILRKYASEYVLCEECKSSDTVLAKENRLMFICCEECGSERSVAHVKRGFEAQIRRQKNAR